MNFETLKKGKNMKQKLNAWFVLCMTLAVGAVAWAADIASSSSIDLPLDTRTERMIAYNSSGISLPLAYSANGWGDGEAAGTAKLTVSKNGGAEETIADGLTGAGVQNFTPNSPATYTFSHTDGNGATITAPITVAPPPYYYLSFTAKGGNAKIKLVKTGNPAELALETSSDGSSWVDYDPEAELEDGATVYFRRKDGSAQGISTDGANYYTFQFDAGADVKIYGGGTVMSLMDGVDYALANEVAEYGFFRLFAGATNLVTAPQLTATTLGKNCYSQMFNGCSKLERVEVSFTNNWPAASTMNWLNGVNATGIFIGPQELKIPGRSASAVPNGWKTSYPTLVKAPSTLENAKYAVSNGKYPIIGCPVGGAMVYSFGRAVEDIVVTVIPDSGYMTVERNPLVIPASELYIYPELDITGMIPKVVKVEWTVGHDAAHGATTNEFICLCDALADLHDDDTLTYCGLSNSIPTDCDFIVSNKNVTVDLANKLLEEPLAVIGLFGGRDTLGDVRLVNGNLSKGVFLDYGCLTLVDGSIVTNATAEGVAIVCTNACNELKFEGSATKAAVHGMPKIALCGDGALIYTKPEFAADTEVVAVPDDIFKIRESGVAGTEDHFYEAGFAKVVNVDTEELYFTIISALEEVENGQTLVFRTNIAESVMWDWTKPAITNVTLNLSNFTWSAGVEDVNGRTFTMINGGSDITIYNGCVSNVFDCSGGKMTFNVLKTVNAVNPQNPYYTAWFQTATNNADGTFNGQITIDRGTYNNMANGVIDGLEVLRGRFSADYEELGHFNSQNGKFAFMRQDTRDWLVVPTNDVTAWVVSTNELVRRAYNSVELAMEYANTNETIEVMKDIDHEVVLPDRYIYKMLKFRNSEHLVNGIAAERHNESYEFKDNGDGTFSLLLKDPRSRKLTFLIVGRGKAWADGVVSKHVKDGTQSVECYSELTPNESHKLKAVAEQDGRHVFWRWEYADGTKLHGDEYELNPYADEIDFVMPPEDMTIKLVFKSPDEVSTTDVTVLCSPDRHGQVYLDGVAGIGRDNPSRYEFYAVKNGDHSIKTVTNAPWRFTGYTTNAVLATYNTIWDNYETQLNMPASIVTAHFINDSVFSATGHDAEKVFDGKGTNITVDVTSQEYDGTASNIVYYSSDLGATWSDENPSFSDAGFYPVLWKVKYGDWADGFDDAGLPGSLIAEGSNSVTITARAITNFLAYIVKPLVADDEGVKVLVREPEVAVFFGLHKLVKDQDYDLTYGPATYGANTVTITGKGNYAEEVTLDYEILVERKTDHLTYYVCTVHTNAILASADADAGSEATGYDSAREIEIPAQFVPEKIDGVPDFDSCKVSAILAGAFTNIPKLVRIKIDAPLKIYGNMIQGLENLEYIDFWGATPADCPYYFYKLGADDDYGIEKNGVGVLVERAEDDVMWMGDLTLLGIADAADTFKVPAQVTKIAATAFAGNPLLREVELHNDITAIKPGLSLFTDMQQTVFTIQGEPNDFLKNYFKLTGHGFVPYPTRPGWYVTFNWNEAEARIGDRGFGKFSEAMAAARDGETITLLKNITNVNVLVTGKNVNIAGGEFEMIGCEFLYTNGDGLRILSGTYDQDLRTKLTYPETDTMEKWFVFDGSYPSNRWTVIKQDDIVCTMTNIVIEGKTETDSINYRTLSDAAYDSKGGETLELIKAKGVTEDVTFTHDITFLGSIEGRRWKGLLTADGASVLVKGTRAAKDGNQMFAVANCGIVQMDYFAGQCAVADPENYSIVRVGPQLWQLLPSESIVAIDLDNPEDRYYDMQLAADNVAGRVLVIKDNYQSITATRNFTLATEHNADNIAVYGGELNNTNGWQVSTLIGSTFGKNYGNDLYFYPDQALANMNKPLNGYANVWCVVPADKVVAQIEGRDPEEYFLTVEAAADQATTEETITILNQVDNPVALSDGNIYKMLKFRDDNDNLKGGVKAERHDDFYELKETAPGIYEFVLKDMPTKKLTFEIEGKGSVLINDRAAQHVELYSAYSELKPGEWYELKAVPTLNGGDAFLRWENADKTRLAPYEAADGNIYNAYDNTISFQMLNEDMTLRLVFDKAANVTQTTLKILPDNSNRTTYVGQVYLDGKKNDNTDEESWMFSNVKPGEHTLYAEPNGPNVYNRFVCWIRDGEVVYDNPYTAFKVADTNYIEMVARFMTTSFVARAENVTKTYDGEGTNITVNVYTNTFKADWYIEYLDPRLDGAPWSTENPVFVEAGEYVVEWRVRSDNDTKFVVDGAVATIAEGKATVKIVPASLVAADSLVYIGLDREYITLGEDNPKVIGRYLNFDLKEGVDFEVTYFDYADVGTATAHVEGKGNYGGSIDLSYSVFQAVPFDAGGVAFEAADGNGYAGVLDGLDSGVVLTSVKPGSCTTAPDGKLEFAVPATITVNMTKPVTISIPNVPVIGVAAGAFDNIPEVQRILFPVEVEIYGNIIRGLENLEYIDFWGTDEKSWDADYKYKKLGEEHGGAGILLKKPVTNAGPFAAGLPLQSYDLYDFNGLELIGVADAANVFSVAGGFDLDIGMHVDIDAIGADAFYGNKNLIEIALTNGVKWLQPGLIEQSNIDTNLMFFSMNAEPTEEIKNFFAGEGLTWFEEPEVANRWTTFNWSVYEARIVNYSTLEKKGYAKFVDAVAAAVNGDTVEVMRDLDGHDHDVTIAGKKVIIDANSRTLTNMAINLGEGGELAILAGTFDFNYEKYLQPSKWFNDPVMEKWYTADEPPSSRWTVIEKSDIVCTMTDATSSVNYRTLSEAAYDSKGGEVLELIKEKGVQEDVTFTHDITFLGSIEGRRWKGLLTAADGAIVLVKGSRAAKDGNQKFAVANGGTVQMDYFAGQCAVADPENYSIVRVEPQLWQLLLTESVVAIDAENEEDRYYDMQLAADHVASAKVLVIRGNDQPITATRDFTITVAGDQVWNGTLDANDYTVQTTLGSKFGKNLIDEFDWSNGLTLVWNGTCYEVVEDSAIVAQFVDADGKIMARFNAAEMAIYSIDTFQPIEQFQIGVNDSIQTYNFGERVKGEQTFKKLVSVGGENTIQNVDLSYGYAVGGNAGTVIFSYGVRVNQNEAGKGFKTGDVELKVVAGAYFYDPTKYCEAGYSAARRAKVGDPLNGYYVVYANSECEVTIVDGTHPVHYKTFQDAIDLAKSEYSTVQLFNDGTINATVWSDKKIILTSDPNGAAQTGADLLTNSVITVEGELVVSNLTLKASRFVVKSTGQLGIWDVENIEGIIEVEQGGQLYVANDKFTAGQITVSGKMFAGNDFNMHAATDGAVIVKDGGQFVLNGNVQIWDNHDANDDLKNVVLENAETGFVLKNRGTFGANLAKVGITCVNGNTAGAQFGTVDAAYPFDLFAEGDNSGDNSNAPIFCDTKPDLRVGRGKTIVGPIHAETNSVRYINNYTAVLYEGKDLITRSGNELVWLECVADPEKAEPKFLGSTRGTLTIGTTPGFDYAFVTNDIAFTNWMSATTDHLTFSNLADHETYALLKRYSITTNTLVSDFVVEGAGIVYRTSKYNAKDVALWFENRCDTFVNEGTLDEMAENQLVKVTVAKDGTGYVVTLKKDSEHDWAIEIPDDAGKLVLDMRGCYLNAKKYVGREGLTFVAATDYDDLFLTDLTIKNDVTAPYTRVSCIVGSLGADGADAVDTGDGQKGEDGSIGIHNKSDRLVKITINGGVEVYGGTAGNGGAAVSGNGGEGGRGGDAMVGNISLTLNGASVFGGLGGNGGTSTYGNGGNGGNGGDAIADNVAGTIIAGGIYGGDAGIGGGVGDAATGKAGKGGNGGNAIKDPENQMIVQGGDFSGDIEIRGGKGGNGGFDGKGGKPAAPATAKVLNLTGTSVTLGVIEGCEYYFLEGVIDPDKTTIPEDGWHKATDNEWFIDGLKRVTTYTVVARIPAKDGNLVSFYSSMTFTTMNTGAVDLENVFDGKGVVTIDENGEYYVTLTDDINHGVRIPDHYGKFTLDMAGHAIVGLNGVKDVSPDGETAILFVPDGADDATEMTITGNGRIIGGDGAERSENVRLDGTRVDGDGGNGGAGIASYGLADTCKVIFDDGELRGGKGADGADTLGGIAGNGGNGGDAYVVSDNLEFEYVGGTLVGGNGGNGGDAIGNLEDLTNGTPGNGGNGGDAINGQGGNGGNGGKSVGGNRFGQGGEEGNKGMEAPSIPGVPGGVSGDYLVRIGDPGSVGKVRYFMTLEEAFDAAKKDETITVFRDYTTVCPIEVCVSNLTLQTAGGATLTLNEDIIVNPEIEFTIDANCKIDESSIGTIEVNGTVNQKGGFAPNYAIMQDGAVIATAGKIGYVAVEEGGRFQVEYKADVTVDGSIDAWNPMNVFLFGGTYVKEAPDGLVRDPFMIVGSDPWKVELNGDFAAMARVDDEIWGIETLNEAFDAIEKSTRKIEIWLLQDATADRALIDQDVVETVIHGYGHTITDARTGDEADVPLFGISDNVRFDNVVFDGQGTEAGQFLRLFETSAVVLDGCTVTGYACRNEAKGSYKTLPLISYSSAGEATVFVLRDTVITNNAVSAAISAIDTTGAGFTTHIGVAGATTIEGSGVGILSDAKLQITAIDELTGGWIDVQFEGTGEKAEFGRITIGADAQTAAHFRYVGGERDGERSCGYAVLGDDGKYYLAWMPDARQYAAIIVSASGETNYFETAEGAFGAVADKDTVILMQDATVGDMMTAKLSKATESYIVDLNGKTLTNDGNKLKLGTAGVKIMNGTLASASKYALYVYGATVALSNTVVEGDVYVAKGKLAITMDDVGVKGSIDKTNVGSVSITAGRFEENPSAYLPTNRGAYPADENSKAEGYNWIVSEATAATGFADGFKPDISFDEDGKAIINLTVEGIGKIRASAKIVYNGNVTGDVTVLPPKGWIAAVNYNPTTGKTMIEFEMDRLLLEPQYGSRDPGDRPVDFTRAADGSITEVRLRIKNAVPGFYYQLLAIDDLDKAAEDDAWVTVSTTQATTAGDLELATPNATIAHKYRFYKAVVSDSPSGK